jgi:hypothetical protein
MYSFVVVAESFLFQEAKIQEPVAPRLSSPADHCAWSPTPPSYSGVCERARPPESSKQLRQQSSMSSGPGARRLALIAALALEVLATDAGVMSTRATRERKGYLTFYHYSGWRLSR